jgi:hypothetical protein
MLVHYEEMTQYKTAKHSLLVYIIPWKMELAKALSVLRVCTITCADVSKKDVTKKSSKRVRVCEYVCACLYQYVCV